MDWPRVWADAADLRRLELWADEVNVLALCSVPRAPFSRKDLLKARGYRWNADARFWQKELDEELVAHEQAWFYCQGLPAPTLRPISAHQRHR